MSPDHDTADSIGNLVAFLLCILFVAACTLNTPRPRDNRPKGQTGNLIGYKNQRESTPGAGLPFEEKWCRECSRLVGERHAH